MKKMVFMQERLEQEFTRGKKQAKKEILEWLEKYVSRKIMVLVEEREKLSEYEGLALGRITLMKEQLEDIIFAAKKESEKE